VNGTYHANKAHAKAVVRRRAAKFQWKKITENAELKKYVEQKLYADHSPEAIAGRLKNVDTHFLYTSKDSIYRYLKSVHGRKLEVYRAKRKTKKTYKRAKVTQLADRVFIDKRPKIINVRGRVGDVEADFIVSGRTGKGILLTIVCRKTRVVFIEKINPVTIENVHKAFQKIQERFPEMKSISTDNDILLQKHIELQKILGLKIYFCHPYHSWEKGSNENANGHIRKYIPKGTDISFYSKSFIKKVEDKLNGRYLKCLQYYTPAEELEKHRKRKKRQGA
jgi:IS30 family transposase